jgi:hypothetical protein
MLYQSIGGNVLRNPTMMENATTNKEASVAYYNTCFFVCSLKDRK